MGVYLSAPKTEKLSDDGENRSVRYGVSSMQGWRSTMEDAVSTHSLTLFYFVLSIKFGFDVFVCLEKMR